MANALQTTLTSTNGAVEQLDAIVNASPVAHLRAAPRARRNLQSQ